MGATMLPSPGSAAGTQRPWTSPETKVRRSRRRATAPSTCPTAGAGRLSGCRIRFAWSPPSGGRARMRSRTRFTT
eukprot:4376494-Alexandrium_andersonii.AAC.1